MKQSDLKSLLNSLSLEEKIGQLVQLSGEFYNASDISLGPQRKLGITQRTVDLSGSVLNVAGAKKVHEVQAAHLKKSKHAIPLIFMSDIIYGYRTVYPIPLGMGATWDPELIQHAYANTAEEAYAGGSQVAFAPMVDLVHDPRWGRVLESTGEDSYLNSCYASAMVKGFQSQLDAGKGIVSCVKHFAAYGAVEAGREYNSTDLSLSNLYQNYLPSYKAAVNAGAKMVMTSLTTLNGVPATADKWLLDDVLRKQWGFDGVIISDYASVYELVQHGFARDTTDAAEKALISGVDIDMKSPCYANGLQSLCEEGKLSESKIDAAVWRVLTLKNELGLFEDPFRGASVQQEETQILTPQKRQVARQVSREAMVLLKNDANILPLSADSDQQVALIGPYASEHELLGLWAVHGDRNDTVTIEAGLREVIGDHLSVAKGTDIIRDKTFFERSGMIPGLAERFISSGDTEQANHEAALRIAQQSDVIVFACGEHTMQSGEAGSRAHLRIPDNQLSLLKELASLNKPIITIVISGRPLVLTEVERYSDALIEAWFPGTEGGHALADVLYGRYNPSGRLSMGMPYTEGQLPMTYAHLSTGRPENNSQHVGRFLSKYSDVQTGPLYSFGYGLSYGSVSYGKVQLRETQLKAHNSLEASIQVTNTGACVRDEVIQLYLHDEVASVVQPVKRLVDFQKCHLQPSETKEIQFTIPESKMGFYDRQGKWCVEPGDFTIFIGPDSDTQNCAEFTLLA